MASSNGAAEWEDCGGEELSGENETWTWIDKYEVWLRPVLPRLCMKCGYNGYFKLREIKKPTPTWPFMEVCPECGNEVEMKESDGIEAIPSKILEKLAERLEKTPQEVYNEVFKNIIMEFDPKTGKARLVRKDTGEEISFG